MDRSSAVAKTRERGHRTSGPEADENITAVKKLEAELCNPKTVVQSQSLMAAEVGGNFLRSASATELPCSNGTRAGEPALEMDALRAAANTEFRD